LASQAQEGQSVIATTSEAQTVVEVDLGPVKEAMYTKIDEAAEAFCLQFMTAGYTQAIRYLEKKEEATQWITGSDPADFPFLAAEAAATDVSIDDLVVTIKQTSAAWKALGAAVEGARMGAKKAIAASDNIAEMALLAHVDWAGLLSG
jgi:BioD-like phosphotransacetylase family protein